MQKKNNKWKRQQNVFEKIEQKIVLYTNILGSYHPYGWKQRKYRK